MTESLVQQKSFDFALMTIQLCRELNDDKEYVLARQLLKAGTSIGANVEEALAAQSKKDFAAKMSIASKEARETRYWLRLMAESGMVSEDRVAAMAEESESLCRMLVSIVKTAQESLNS